MGYSGCTLEQVLENLILQRQDLATLDKYEGDTGSYYLGYRSALIMKDA